MEGLRDSKLGEGQQWGKNSSSKDKVDWGRRPTYIGTPESNRYAHSPHRAVLPLQGAVLPLGRLWPLENQRRRGKRHRSGTTAGGSGSTTGGAVLPLPPTVLPLRLRAEGRREEEARAVLAAVVATVLPLTSGTTAAACGTTACSSPPLLQHKRWTTSRKRKVVMGTIRVCT